MTRLSRGNSKSVGPGLPWAARPDSAQSIRLTDFLLPFSSGAIEMRTVSPE